jgi:flagella basal body P-ring formation protein FlgA
MLQLHLMKAVKRIALSFLSIMLWLPLANAESISLLQKAEVDSEGIFLDQVVSAKSGDAISNILLAPAPAWGQTRVINRTELAQLLTKASPTVAANNNLSGALEVRVTRRSEKLLDQDLVRLLIAKLMPSLNNEQPGELDLRLGPQWKSISIPAGKSIDLRILDKPSSGLARSFYVRFEVLSGQESIGVFTVFLQARLERNVWVARGAVKRGTALDAADLIQERRDVIGLPSPAWTGETLDSALQLTEPLSAGAVVYARSVKARPVVFRGQPIQAVVKDEFMTVSMKVEVLEDGVPGQIIRARNLRSKKEIRGKVIDEDTIQVIF